MKYGSSVWLATALSYLDRAAAFIFPLFVLRLLGKPEAYTSIEYVISLSIILATFFDAGLRSYLLFHAKKIDSARVAISSAIGAFKPLIAIHVVALLVVYGINSVFQSSEGYLIGLAIARASALSIIGLIMQSLILTGRPALAPLASIANWCLSCVILMWPDSLSDSGLVTLFFTGSFAIVTGAACLGLLSRPVPTTAAWSHLKESFNWGWPLLLSAGASMLVANFSKVYAFSNLSSHEVLAFTFWMRAFSIFQLSHVAMVSVLIGQIYQSKNPGIMHSNLFRYTYLITPPAIVIAVLAFFSSLWEPLVPALESMVALVLFAYFIFWCFGAYFEIYLTRNGANAVILKASLASSSMYLLGIIFVSPSNALELSALMACAAVLYTVLIINTLRQQK